MTSNPQSEMEQVRANALEAERYLKGIGNHKRLMILCVLMDRELSVGEINAQIDLSQSALSQHLAVMRELGFLATRKEAQVVYYRVVDDKVSSLLDALYQTFCQ
jgi:DNA-binding transcriptional ArsR family regulator